MNAISRQSAFHGREKRIGKYKVDGYCQEQNKVFEFHGNYWHAHQCMFRDETALHPSIKHKDKTPKTIKEVCEYDKEKLEYFEGKGYTVEIKSKDEIITKSKEEVYLVSSSVMCKSLKIKENNLKE